MDYMTLKEAAEKWGVTSRRVNYYCAAGSIPGAVKMAGVWLIPKNAEKPVSYTHLDVYKRQLLICAEGIPCLAADAEEGAESGVLIKAVVRSNLIVAGGVVRGHVVL